MLVYRWEDEKGIGFFQKGFASYLLETNMTGRKYDLFKRTVHDKVTLPEAENWYTCDGVRVESIWDAFGSTNVKFAFKSYEDARNFVPPEWDEDLWAFGCQLVCYDVPEDSAYYEDAILFGDTQVVFKESYAHYKGEVI
jgi:hypothetical protein